jgi:hypothetical protein
MLYVLFIPRVEHKFSVTDFCIKFVALGEADTEIARLALSRNYFGVLAEDSDYHILGVNYISLKSLGFVDEDDTGSVPAAFPNSFD